MLTPMLPMAMVALAGFTPHAVMPAAGKVATCRTPAMLAPHRRTASPLLAQRNVVVVDMDETLISQKSTGYIIKFCFMCRAWIRLLFGLPTFVFLIPLSKVSRALAVRMLYWMAFRGIRVDRAQKIADEQLSPLYVTDLQDPAASAIIAADDAVVLTASPEFMAKPWLSRYLNVPPANVYGAKLEVKNGRFTGRLTDALPIGQKKVELLEACPACVAPGAVLTGYGDHPTDVPFLERCDTGVLVHELPAELAGACEYQPASAFDASKLAPASD